MKRSFFQAAVTSILLYGCTTWTLTKRLEKKLDGNYTRMLRAILNKSWRQHPTRHQLYGHLPPITKTIQVRRARHAGHSWRSRDEFIRDVLLWTPTHGRAKAGRPARTYIQQLCEDTGCCPEDLPKAMNDREEWRERVRDICATSAIWWWWLNKFSLAGVTGSWLGSILVFIVKLSVTNPSFPEIQSPSKIGPLDLTAWNDELVNRVLYLTSKRLTFCSIDEPANATNRKGVSLSYASFKCLNAFKGIRLLILPLSTLVFIISLSTLVLICDILWLIVAAFISTGLVGASYSHCFII